MNIQVSQVGFNRPKLTLSMRMFGPRNSAHAFWHTYFLYGFPLDKLTYISREFSIEQPSVGVALLAQLFYKMHTTSTAQEKIIVLNEHHFCKFSYSF